MAGSVVPFKVYLILNESDDAEIRRFGLPASQASSFHNFSRTITELFPSVANKTFRIYWEDEDGDSVAVSSDEEFIIALTSMNSDTKKFFVKIQSLEGSQEDGNTVSHPGIYCDGCECDVVGTRYKCLICKNYDLCWTCEKAGIHTEHPMLKIPHPLCFDRVNLTKLIEFVSSSIPFRATHCQLRRRHSHDTGHSDSHRKKKRSEKRDAVHDTGDEMDEGWHKKHSHKKSRKQSACPYSQMMEFFNPVHFESSHAFLSPKKTREEGGHLTYLKSIATTVQKLLDPLGVNVELEVRPNRENVETKGKEKKKEEEEQPTQSPSAPAPETDAAPSAPPQKEVRFVSPEQIAQTVKQGIEEITKTLASQKINIGNSADNDGWVSFEELKRDSEKSQADGSVETPEEEKSATQTEKRSPETSSENLYPDLSSEHFSPRVREALKHMLSMGFSNEGNWLAHLLEAKQGDIIQTLEVLSPIKKK